MMLGLYDIILIYKGQLFSQLRAEFASGQKGLLPVQKEQWKLSGASSVPAILASNHNNFATTIAVQKCIILSTIYTK